MVCPHCGKEIKHGKFCQYCGGKTSVLNSCKLVVIAIIMVTVIGLMIMVGVSNHISMISDQQFCELMQTVCTSRIENIDSRFWVDELTILSKKKDKESKQIKVTCNVIMTDETVTADVRYVVLCNKSKGKWHITKTDIERVLDVRPLRGVAEPTDIVEESLQKLYPQINWGYTDYNVFRNNIDYNFPLAWSLRERDTDLENKKETFVYEYSFSTYTAQVTGVAELEYLFCDGMWSLNKVENKESNIKWNLEEVWSFDIYSYYSDTFITNINWETCQAEIWCRGAVIQGAGKFQKTILGFSIDDDMITFKPLKVSKQSGDMEIEFVARLDDMYVNGMAIGGKSQYLTKEDVQNVITQTMETLRTDVENIAFLILDGDMYRRSRIKVCNILSRVRNSNDLRTVNIKRDALFYLNDDESNQNRYGKFQYAYTEEGAEQTIRSLNLTLDLDICNFIAIGKKELAEIVNLLGGISYNINEEDLQLINNNCESKLSAIGNISLNGEQVVALVMPVVGSKRSCDEQEELDMQKEILSAISYKLACLDTDNYNNVKDSLIQNIYTSMEADEAITLLRDYAGMENIMCFPGSDTSKRCSLGPHGSCIYSDDMMKEVQELHAFLYGNTNYEVSENVESISKDMEKFYDSNVIG